MTASGVGDLMEVLATAGLRGGQIYDALVAATAKGAGAHLLSIDRRAERTYRAVGIDYEFIGCEREIA